MLVLGGAPAWAHLMQAQKGTLNITPEAAFLVLSVPVSALQGVDDDADAALSPAELQAHEAAIRAQVAAGVQLLGPQGPLPLQLLMVDGAPPDNAPASPARQLAVLGRFALPPVAAGVGAQPPASPQRLRLRFSLFGTDPGERQQDLTITRGQERQWLRFTPARDSHDLLPGTAAVLAEYAASGATHVLRGADHLLFLLVVLSAGWGWRSLVGVLSCFTAGHALTLAACVGLAWTPPARLVEPAIAATLVGMAALDAWGRRRGRPVAPPVRLALVFLCALVHGLGLAEGLGGLTQWPLGSGPMLWALGGFNLGVESAQLAVAAAAGLLGWGLGKVAGGAAQQQAARLATLAGLCAGAWWLVERVLQAF